MILHDNTMTIVIAAVLSAASYAWTGRVFETILMCFLGGCATYAGQRLMKWLLNKKGGSDV